MMKQTLRVLIVEDSVLDAELLSRELKQSYEVAAKRVDTEKTFVNALTGNKWDLILCDYRLPGFSGLAALHLFIASGIDIPFIFVSGAIGEETAVEAMKAGAHDYVMKGNLKRLVPAVERELREVREHKQRRKADVSLGESERTFTTLAEESPNMIFINKKGKVVYANKKCEEIMGYTRKELYSSSFDFLSLIAPEQIEAVRESFAKHSQDIEIPPYEYSLVTKSGRQLEAILTTKLITYEGERSILGIVTDVTERKQGELRLRRALEWQQALVESSRDAVFISDTDSRFVAVNKAACDLTGYTREEMLLMRIPDLHDKADLDGYTKYHTRILQGETVLDEAKILRKDGIKVETELNNTSFEVAGLRYVHTTARDITERKIAENRLRESDFLIREAQRVGRIGTYVQDFVTGIWQSSEVLDDIFGIGREYERNVGGWLALVHPDQQQEMAEYLREISSKKQGFYKEYRIIRHSDREERWVLGRGELSYDEFGTLTRMIGTIQDITERKRVEEALHLQVSALKSAANSVVITDTNGVIQWVNPAFTKMTGYEFDEVVGKNPRILKSGRQDATHYAKMWETILAGKVWHGEMINKRKDGSLYDEEMTITPVIATDGRIRNFVAVKQDVTEQKNAEERQKALESQLVQVQKMEGLGTLAAGIAHDFNNILGIILGHVSLLAHSKNDPVVLSNSVDTVTKAVRRGASLVRQILTFARKTEIAKEPVNVNTLIVELLKMFGETFPKTIEIVTDLDSSIPVLAMDQTQLQQAIMNLCINARDAMVEQSESQLPKGRMTIRTSRVSSIKIHERFADAVGSEYVCVEISDTGIGMSQRTKGKIFEPFFTTKETGKGTGLGLAVVYGVVKGHQGYIDVQSEEGKGTTFYLYFPSSASNVITQDARKTIEPVRLSGHETIMIVEDEESLLNLMTTFLVRSGYTVIAARDGVEAIDQYEEHQKEIALVLTDMGLPKLDGTEVFAMLKLRNPDVKVILASGYLEPQYRSELLKTGAKDFIQKPYQPDEVLRKIRAILDVK
jgi:two-component system cell cycle sensor histidine kinase/response regulator CckA